MTIYKTGKRKYYKYSTELDTTVVGTFAKIDKGVASGFSTSQYLKVPTTFNPENNAWNLVLKFNINNLNYQYILGSSEGTDYSAPLVIGVGKYADANGKLLISISSTSYQGNTVLSINTDYWVKVDFTGTVYNVYLSTTGEFNGEEKLEISISSAPLVSATNIVLGTYRDADGSILYGSIDLSQSYININGTRWWSGDNYTKVGSWIDDGVVGSFTSANYLTVPEVLPSEITSSEYVFKITTGASVTSPENQIISAHKSPNTGNIVIRGSKFHLFTGSWNAGITTVLPNTTYILKTIFDGSSWTLYSSTDNTDWVQEATWTTTNSYAGTNLYVGRDYDTTGEYFTGSIDLNQSYIKINGKMWWHGTKAYQVNLGGEDIYQDWKQPVLTENGALGGDEFAVSASSYQSTGSFEPWKAFDNISEYEDYNAWLSGTTTMPVYFVFYNPKPLKVKKLSIKNFAHRNNPNYIIGSGEVLGSDNNTDWTPLKTFTNTVGVGGEVWDIDLSTNEQGFKYYKINITSSLNTNGDVGIGELSITAKELVAVGGDSYDYSAVEPDKIKDLYKATERKYYKYDYQDWVQPVLTANGVLGEDEFAVSSNVAQYSGQGVYKLFDDSTSGCFHSTSGITTGYIDLYNPNPLNITNILVNNQNAGGSENRASTSGNIYGSDNGSDWEQITSYTNTVQGINEQWNIDLSSNNKAYKYYRIESTAGGTGGYWTIGELTITAKEQVAVELNINGPDVYQDWKQPVLSANGTLGRDKFAVYCAKASSSYPIYKAFDGSSSNFTDIAHPDSNVIIYNPKPLKVTTIKIANRSDVEVTAVTGYTIYGSNDNSSWEELVSGTNDITSKGSVWDIDLSSNTKGFKYYKIDITSAYISTGTYQIAEITLIAQELKAVGGTIEDADYSLVPAKQIVAAYKTGKRKYYKYSTEPNATIAGSPTIVDGVVSGFSTSNYLKLSEVFNPQSNPWEALFKVKINTLINGSQIILGQRNSGGYDFYVDVNTVRLSVGDTAFAGTTTLQENTTYWFKYIFTGDTYVVKSSTNGVDWVDEINTASTVTATPTSDDCRIGVWYNTYASGLGNPWGGSIDLNESYIKINGKMWWHGTKAYQVNLGGEDIYEDWKQPTLTANGTLGGNTFAVRANQLDDSHPAYKAFDKSASTYWYNSASGDAEYYIYNPNPLCITNIEVKNRADGDADNEITSGAVYGSDDGNAWTELVSYTNTVNALGGTWQIPLTENKTYYKYYKIAGTHASRYVAVSEFTLTAKELVAVGSDVYDYSAVETPQLVYDYVKKYLTAADWTAVKSSSSGGNVWGSDTSHHDYYSGSTSDTFTFNTLQPSGKWHLTFRGWQQFNFRHNSFIVTITYEDGTTEQVWNSVSILPNGATANTDYTIPLTMTKKWKTINVYNAGGRVNSVNCFGGVGMHRLLWRGSEQQ